VTIHSSCVKDAFFLLCSAFFAFELRRHIFLNLGRRLLGFPPLLLAEPEMEEELSGVRTPPPPDHVAILACASGCKGKSARSEQAAVAAAAAGASGSYFQEYFDTGGEAEDEEDEGVSEEDDDFSDDGKEEEETGPAIAGDLIPMLSKTGKIVKTK